MNFPFSSTLNSFFLPALNLAKGGHESQSEFSAASNLLEISDVSISDLSIHDDPIAAETSFVVRVQHRSQRPSPYQSRKPTNLPSLRRERSTRQLTRIPESRLRTSDESPIPALGRRRTLSEPSVPSVLSVSSAGKYKCVHVKSAGTVVHPDTDEIVLHLKTEPPEDVNLDALKVALLGSLSSSCNISSTGPCTCELILTPEQNPEYRTLLDVLNTWCSTHIGSPSPGWNALRVFHAGSSSNTFETPKDTPHCVMQLGGSYTLQIFPNTKSDSPHNLLLEVPLGPVSTVFVTNTIAAGSTITAAATPGPLHNDPTPIQLIPIRLSSTCLVQPATKEVLNVDQVPASDDQAITEETRKVTPSHEGTKKSDSQAEREANGHSSCDTTQLQSTDEQSLTLELDHANYSPVAQVRDISPEEGPTMGKTGNDSPTHQHMGNGQTATVLAGRVPCNTSPGPPKTKASPPSTDPTELSPTKKSSDKTMRPRGLFIKPEIARLILSKIKSSDLGTLAEACGVSFSNQTDTKANVEKTLGDIYKGTAPLTENLANIVVLKLNNKQVNDLLDCHLVPTTGRQTITERRKALLNLWLPELVGQDGDKAPASGKQKKKKKRQNKADMNTCSPASQVGTSESINRNEDHSPTEEQNTASINGKGVEGGNIGEQIFILEKSILELRSETDKNSHCIDLLLDEDPRKTVKGVPAQGEEMASFVKDLQGFQTRLVKLENESKRVIELCETIRKNREAIDDVLRQMQAMQAGHGVGESYQPPAGATSVVSNHPESDPRIGRDTYRRALLRNSNQPEGRVTRHSHPNMQTRHTGSNPSQGTGSGHLTRRVVLLHDGTYDKFDPSLFVSRYDVVVVHCPSLKKATTDNSILERVESLNPFSVLVHLGTKDIYDGRPVDTLLSEVNSLTLRLTKSAHTCISLPIVPQAAGLQGFVDKITEFNTLVADFVSSLRRTPQRGMTKKPFTCSKPMLTPVARVVTSAPYIVINSPAGQAKLWLKLRDALDRMSGLRPPRDRTQADQSQAHGNSPPVTIGSVDVPGEQNGHVNYQTDPDHSTASGPNSPAEADQQPVLAALPGSTPSEQSGATTNVDIDPLLVSNTTNTPVSTQTHKAPLKENSNDHTS